MTSEEAMALAVLKGDMTAARALADAICENYEKGATKLPPIIRIPSENNIRVAIFCKEGITIDYDDIQEIERRVTLWLEGSEPILMLAGVERLELYEML